MSGELQHRTSTAQRVLNLDTCQTLDWLKTAVASPEEFQPQQARVRGGQVYFSKSSQVMLTSSYVLKPLAGYSGRSTESPRKIQDSTINPASPKEKSRDLLSVCLYTVRSLATPPSKVRADSCPLEIFRGLPPQA